ncbi:MAG: nucleoside 2-deoxyribosyltransferase domain-containing protein [Planctomycetota bacterium]|jgi:8-oxo-dGTP pyrophosphatase MutT (NUDIX family)
MHVVYAKQDPPERWNHAIFLAGPTPRDPETPSWRPDALKILEAFGYQGVVFIPEHEDGRWQGSYQDQVDWEHMGLEMADKIVFWVPRDLRTMPALTTNVEFGNYVRSGKAVLGHPDGAPKMRYLDWLAGEHDTPVYTTMTETLGNAIGAFVEGGIGLEKGALRSAGERWVPAALFKTPMFQAWYKSQVEAGNRLDEARVLWTFTIPKKPELGIFSYILWAKVWIGSEGRHKENEWTFSRTDTACVVLYWRPESAQAEGASPIDIKIVLVKEFRVPARTPDGFIHELPGGSCEAADDSAATSAAREVYEETGLPIDASRLRYVGSRQALGILSSHQVHCYAVELTDAEIAEATTVAESGETFGETQDTERTYVEIKTVRQMLQEEMTDWTTIGTVMRALTKTF